MPERNMPDIIFSKFYAEVSGCFAWGDRGISEGLELTFGGDMVGRDILLFAINKYYLKF